MGGTGKSRHDLQFVNANYINKWGGNFGGEVSFWDSSSEWVLSSQGSTAIYWSRSEVVSNLGGAISFSNLEHRRMGLDNINPVIAAPKTNGYSLRCIR
jgi:hypothetical protein